ncbi:aminopeptidase [Gorillibacterium sp. sgz500922]|uniref:aminopeptidase n=1 Tax=Gorillibacterium sp. sgz500922 TaxID=3446694 RepID=UPI003F6698B5
MNRETFKRNLEHYAELAVRVGINLQPGQTLVVNAPITADEFVRVLAAKAYEAGAGNVHVEWTDERLTALKYRVAPEEALTRVPTWKPAGMVEFALEGAAFMTVKGTDPDLFAGIDPARIAKASKALAEANREYSGYTRASIVSWLVVTAPNEGWASKIFTDVSPEEAVDKLWEQIFRLTRSDRENPVEAWREHIEKLGRWASHLNAKQYRRLHFKAPGTELAVGLPEGHKWISAGEKNAKGIPFVANIPTEEVFSAPSRDDVSGYVTSTKPLNYNGARIENFTLTFEGGRITEVKAETGEDVLRALIATDEGACRLGEVALVPHESPVSQSGLVFFNTLYDENASCHLAIGASYPTCAEEGTGLSRDELKKRGFNQSLVHTDFMIGSAEMDIDGETADGSREPIFRSGAWVI